MDPWLDPSSTLKWDSEWPIEGNPGCMLEYPCITLGFGLTQSWDIQAPTQSHTFFQLISFFQQWTIFSTFPTVVLWISSPRLWVHSFFLFPSMSLIKLYRLCFPQFCGFYFLADSSLSDSNIFLGSISLPELEISLRVIAKRKLLKYTIMWCFLLTH